jgi:hypothetical protein
MAEEEPIRLASSTTLKVRGYDLKNKTYTVDFNPTLKYTSSGRKREVSYLKRLSRKHLEVICTGLSKDTNIEAGDELSYEPERARGLVKHFKRRSLGYELCVREVNEKGVKVRIRPGKKSGSDALKEVERYFTLDQFRGFSSVYLNGRVPKAGEIIAVYRQEFEKALNLGKKTEKKIKVENPADADVNADDIELPSELVGSGLENRVEESD